MGGVSALFTSPSKTEKVNESVQKEDLEKTHGFSLIIPIDGYQYIRGLASLKAKQGDLNYNLKAAFVEGLELLKKENPSVTDEASLERRFYRGGGQKQKIESFATSVVVWYFAEPKGTFLFAPLVLRLLQQQQFRLLKVLLIL